MADMKKVYDDLKIINLYQDQAPTKVGISKASENTDTTLLHLICIL